MSLRGDLIEAAADAVDELPYDTLELRNWGEESVADPYRIVSEAVLDAFLDTLADRADEWMMKALITAYGNVRGGEHLDADDLIAVLRGDTE